MKEGARDSVSFEDAENMSSVHRLGIRDEVYGVGFRVSGFGFLLSCLVFLFSGCSLQISGWEGPDQDGQVTLDALQRGDEVLQAVEVLAGCGCCDLRSSAD